MFLDRKMPEDKWDKEAGLCAPGPGSTVSGGPVYGRKEKEEDDWKPEYGLMAPSSKATVSGGS